MMFGEAERRIMNLDSSMKANTSRINACENEIYKLNNHMYAGGPIWSKIGEIECSVRNLTERLADTIASLETLAASIEERLDAIRAEASEKPENPKQKIDLEILEEKSEFEVGPFITPDYYLYDEKY